jgi:hypothetical protein
MTLLPDVPREVKTPLDRVAIALMAGILIGSPLLVVLSMSVPDILKYRRLMEAGVEGWAIITEVHDRTSRGNHIHYASYTYTIDGRSYAGQDRLTYEKGADLLPDGRLPILYDPVAPGRSVVDRDPAIEDRYKRSLQLLEVPGGIFLVPLLLAATAFSARYFKERRLLKWGTAARATIVGDERVSQPRGGESLTLHYQFIDALGTIYRGEKENLPVPEKEDAFHRATRLRIMTNPVALYHPKHPELNALYPFDWVKLRYEMPILSSEINE